MARPKKENAQRKTHCVSFWLTADEFASLVELAALARVRFAELARRFTIAGGDRLVIKPTQACDPALLAHLGQIGNNLNQLTRKAHVSGTVNPRLDELCDRIEEIIDDAAAGDSA